MRTAVLAVRAWL